MEHRTGGVQGLKVILQVEGLKHIIGIAHGDVGAVGVERGLPYLRRRDDVREILLVVLGKPIGRGLGRGRLQVEQHTVLGSW